VSTALWYALIAAGATLLGGVVIVASVRAARVALRPLMGFGAGFMLATVIVGMVPHALEDGARGAAGILIGYLLVHLTQHAFTTHFHFGEETHDHAMVDRWVGITALLGLSLHAFFDGVAIGAAFGVGEWLGLLVFAAIVLHKMPEGVTMASVMLASGNSPRRALAATGLLGTFTLLGVFLTEHVGVLQRSGLALSAGVTLYVAASNLIPEVQEGRSFWTTLAVLLGAASFYLTYSLLRGGVALP
jgi:zinc and cadmium transporter